ncbi:MAG: EAL domain-containing protein [Eubacteriales bacterium]|nr:EAL domain-containing protein [Eubacteriales bacterium]
MAYKRKDRSIFRITLAALVMVLVLGMLLMAGSLFFSGVTDRLDQNARDILDKQVENRKNFLQNSMVDYWADLTMLAQDINIAAKQMADQGQIRMEELDSGSDACLPLLQEISGSLISTLYGKQVSGIFVVFNTHDLDEAEGDIARPGIYIRDMDPYSTPSQRNADLLVERAPIQMLQSLEISTDSSWKPLITENCLKREGFLYKPFQAAYKDEEKQKAEEYGYWTTESYTLEGDDRCGISYSMPLILSDGTVYGVVGVEILIDHLEGLLPNEELQDKERGTYLLGTVSEEEGGRCVEMRMTAMAASPFFTRSAASKPLHLEGGEGGWYLEADGSQYYAAMESFSLYSRNGPFSDDQWVLVGMVRCDQLFEFSRQLLLTMTLASLIALGLGISMSVAASRGLSRPITKLSDEVAQSRERGVLPNLSKTGIREIDHFSNAITELSQEVLDTSTKFLRIMDMASVELGGYELRDGTDYLYMTENFFQLLGMGDLDPQEMTADGFRETLGKLDEIYDYRSSPDGHKVYRIPLQKGKVRYLHMEVTCEGGREVGVAEDVTEATMERLRVEHERDYDSLTGLYSRRAFLRESELLLNHPEEMKYAAMLMIDLDNLKSINDSFGHDWGDQYIRQAGRCMVENTPGDTLCARVSGDEFFILLHGYDTPAALRDTLQELSRAIQGSVIRLPSGRELTISASGGVAWYPEDSTDLATLMKYADFAMYQVKRSHKGEMGDFDLGAYNQEAYQNQSKREFHQLLSHELLTYHFQPIVSGETGRPVAYEALMRVDLPTLQNPDAVMRMARSEGCLHEIEALTVFKSVETFCGLLEDGAVEEDALLFINSIASESLTREETEDFCRRFRDFQSRIVVEITEGDTLDRRALEIKRRTPGFSGKFALDDYGSGYNSEKNLLDMQPKFIKVDMAIIRDVDTDTDKQQILSNIAVYAHQRGMQIIAEGVETASEMTKCLELGTDLFQGYYLARPSAVPGKINPDALALIRHFRELEK